MAGLIQSGFQWLGDQVVRAVVGDVNLKLQQAGQAVVAKAQSLAPVKTGELRASIGYQVVGTTLTIFTTARHSMFQEFGTRTIRPHPYLRPALNEINRVFGTSIEMVFSAPTVHQPILAHQAGFIAPKTLTHKQRQHVAAHLLPASKRHFKGNVRRAKMRVQRAFP